MRLFLTLTTTLLTTLLFLVTPVMAEEDFTSDYQVEYFLRNEQGKIGTRVKFTINLTNLRSDVYVNKIAIGFPKSFVIKSITASDDRGAINPRIIADDQKTNIQLQFTD